MSSTVAVAIATESGERTLQSVVFSRSEMRLEIWWVWRSWLARQIVALEAEGSSPSTHPRLVGSIINDSFMGHSQAVRHRTLTPALVGSNPTGPAAPLGFFFYKMGY